ncbi:GNAT family N-acetyltransferase [Atlantibacter hermannii]|uniref:GNAT family N-acetyltransferase n=1 Tax=Atlantibacter hermannii TaxID=565 RepID=UPI00289F44EA|nr:GNAT family N-acetyltransferase [Atlantibacter hermannii]
MAKEVPVIRRYHPRDFPDVVEVFLRSVGEVASTDYNEAQTRAWAQIDEQCWMVRLSHAWTFVACYQHELAGFITLEHDGHIDLLFVHPAYQRQKTATALLDRLESQARAQNISTLYTEASITARPFFERHGFTVMAKQTVALRGEHFVNYRMQKWLDDALTLLEYRELSE